MLASTYHTTGSYGYCLVDEGSHFETAVRKTATRFSWGWPRNPPKNTQNLVANRIRTCPTTEDTSLVPPKKGQVMQPWHRDLTPFFLQIHDFTSWWNPKYRQFSPATTNGVLWKSAGNHPTLFPLRWGGFHMVSGRKISPRKANPFSSHLGHSCFIQFFPLPGWWFSGTAGLRWNSYDSDGYNHGLLKPHKIEKYEAPKKHPITSYNSIHHIMKEEENYPSTYNWNCTASWNDHPKFGIVETCFESTNSPIHQGDFFKRVYQSPMSIFKNIQRTQKVSIFTGHFWGVPLMGVPLVIIHVHRMFPYINHPAIGGCPRFAASSGASCAPVRWHGNFLGAARAAGSGTTGAKFSPPENGKTSPATGWWFEPLWKVLVNWDDYSQYMQK